VEIARNRMAYMTKRIVCNHCSWGTNERNDCILGSDEKCPECKNFNVNECRHVHSQTSEFLCRCVQKDREPQRFRDDGIGSCGCCFVCRFTSIVDLWSSDYPTLIDLDKIVRCYRCFGYVKFKFEYSHRITGELTILTTYSLPELHTTEVFALFN
jgi:hypothetical protein